VARPTREDLEVENARLGGLVADLERKLAERDVVVAEQAERLKKLEELVEQVRRRGKRQSAPFSKNKPVRVPAKSGRKSGDAHGVHGHRRRPDRVDRELEAPVPDSCPCCGGDIVFDRWDEQFEVELPDPRPVVTRFKIGIGHCAACNKRVQGCHPEQTSDALGAAASHVGPNAMALALWFHYVLGLSFGKASKALERFGVKVTPGALVSAAEATGRALVPTTTAIRKAVAAADCVTMDETGWRIGGHSAWLWVASTSTHTVYNVVEGRRFEDATRLVPEDYTGTVCRDGYVVYRNYTEAKHQTCAAHLLRRCVEMIEADHPQGQATPRQVKTLLTEALAARDLADEARAAEADRIGRAFDTIIARRQHCDADRKLVKHLGNERHALLTFLTDPAVDATNWRGEQAIRPAVVNRKVWGGNRSDRGAATQSRVMTYFRTAVQQGLDPIAGLVALARAPDRHIIDGLGLT